MSNILTGKFEHGDFVASLREFDACSAANGWKVTDDTDEKILKLPAFLRWQAASHFQAIPSAQRASYADAIAALKQAMCPATHRENFYAEFESRTLRSVNTLLSTAGNWETYCPRLTRPYHPTLPLHWSPVNICVVFPMP